MCRTRDTRGAPPVTLAHVHAMVWAAGEAWPRGPVGLGRAPPQEHLGQALYQGQHHPRFCGQLQKLCRLPQPWPARPRVPSPSCHCAPWRALLAPALHLALHLAPSPNLSQPPAPQNCALVAHPQSNHQGASDGQGPSGPARRARRASELQEHRPHWLLCLALAD